jgi:tetratricopeptide (TPR) repeat protein
VDDANVELASSLGRADTNAWLTMVSNACGALREGGQPLRAIAYVDRRTAVLRQQSDYSDLPYHLQGCRAVALLRAGRFAEAESGILQAGERALKGGVTFQAGSYQAYAVAAALARGDRATAGQRWQPLAPDLARRLEAHEKGAQVVRLLLISAQLAIADGRAADALKSLELAQTLIAARRQPVNADASEVEAARSAALLGLKRYQDALSHAQSALELARASAVDPDSSAPVGIALLRRAQSEAALGRQAEAAATARQSLAHLTPNLDPAHPLIALAQTLAAGGPAAR